MGLSLTRLLARGSVAVCIAALLSTGIAVPAVAETGVTDCDTYASDPDDPHRKAPGVPITKVGLGAVLSCGIAAGIHSDEPRLRYLLGRSNAAVGAAAEAIKQFKMAADAGYPMAQFRIGLAHQKGVGFAVDPAAARQWHRKAADGGVPIAQFLLARMFERGEGGPASTDQALHYYRLAAKGGIEEAEAKVAELGTVKTPPPATTAPATTPPAQPSAPKDMVLAIQTMLGTLGYDAGTPDGLMGRRTRSAISQFQRDRGLTVDGIPDAELQEELTAAVDAMAAARPKRIAEPAPPALANFRRTGNAAISGHNDRHLTGVSPEDCAKACVAETAFACRSFDYYKGQNRCDLSARSADQVGGLATGGSYDAYDHYARPAPAIAAAPSPAAPSPAAPPPAAPIPAPPRPVAAPAPPAPLIVATSPGFVPDEGVEVRFENLPAKGQDWLAIAGKGQTPQQYFDLVMLAGRPTSGTHRFKPLPPGDYEVRLYTDWPAGGYAIVASVPVSVVAPTPLPAAPPPAAPPPAAPLPAAPLPAAPLAAAPVPPAAVTATVAGAWTAEGPATTLNLDQVMDLVEGTLGNPDGRFEGSFSDGQLTGLWAIPDGTAGAACQGSRLGATRWGKLEAVLSADGNVLDGRWGSCDTPPTRPFNARRRDAPARSSSAPARVPTPAPTAAPVPAPEPAAAAVPEPSPVVSGILDCEARDLSQDGLSCKKLKSEQTFAAGRDGQHRIACAAGKFAGLLPGGRLRTCELAAPTTLVPEDMDGATVSCPGGIVQFDEHGLDRCEGRDDPVVFAGNGRSYACGYTILCRQQDKASGTWQVSLIECNANSGGAVAMASPLGELRCGSTSLHADLAPRGCSRAAAVAFTWAYDGEAYDCPQGSAFSFLPDGSLKSMPDGCTTDNAAFKARLAQGGLPEPACNIWAPNRYAKDGPPGRPTVISARCEEKDIVDELVLRPGRPARVLCESGYRMRGDGTVTDCTLAAPARIPVPDAGGTPASCRDRLQMTADGTVMRCTLAEPSAVQVTLPGGGGGVCAGGELLLFPDGTLRQCEALAQPVDVQTAKARLTCGSLSYGTRNGVPNLSRCGLAAKGDARDGDGNRVSCDPAGGSATVALTGDGGIDVKRHAKGGDGLCKPGS